MRAEVKIELTQLCLVQLEDGGDLLQWSYLVVHVKVGTFLVVFLEVAELGQCAAALLSLEGCIDVEADLEAGELLEAVEAGGGGGYTERLGMRHRQLVVERTLVRCDERVVVCLVTHGVTSNIKVSAVSLDLLELHLLLDSGVVVSAVSFALRGLPVPGSLPGPVLVVRELCHVQLPKPLGLLNEGISLWLTESSPSLAQQFGDLGVVAVGSVLYDLVSLYLTPHHEGVHGSLHVVDSIPLELRGVRVGRGGGGADVVTGQRETHLVLSARQ